VTRAAWRLTPFQVPERTPVGTNRAPASKLSEEMVRCIRRAYANGHSLEALQADYPEVTGRAVKDIVLNRAWRWVKV
jgi:hypothetical protein